MFPRDTLGAGRRGEFRLKVLEAAVWPKGAAAKGYLMPLPRAVGSWRRCAGDLGQVGLLLTLGKWN